MLESKEQLMETKNTLWIPKNKLWKPRNNFWKLNNSSRVPKMDLNNNLREVKSKKQFVKVLDNNLKQMIMDGPIKKRREHKFLL